MDHATRRRLTIYVALLALVFTPTIIIGRVAGWPGHSIFAWSVLLANVLNVVVQRVDWGRRAVHAP